MRHLELPVPIHVADHVHADLLVQELLQLVRQGEILHHERIERQAQVGKHRLQELGDRLAKRHLIGRHVEERHITVRKGVGHTSDDGIANLPFQVGDGVQLPCAADFRIKRTWIAQAV